MLIGILIEVILGIISYIVANKFFKKNKWIAFSLILWGIILVILIICSSFLFDKLLIHYNFENYVLDIVMNAMIVLYLEPIHHILFIIAVVWLIVKWYKNRTNNRIGN